MFVFFIHLWNLGKISIFLGFSGSFAMKNDNIHIFFSFCSAGFAQEQKYTAWHGNCPYCKIPTEKEPIRARGFAWDWLCHIINTNIIQMCLIRVSQKQQSLIYVKNIIHSLTFLTSTPPFYQVFSRKRPPSLFLTTFSVIFLHSQSNFKYRKKKKQKSAGYH